MKCAQCVVLLVVSTAAVCAASSSMALSALDDYAADASMINYAAVRQAVQRQSITGSVRPLGEPSTSTFAGKQRNGIPSDSVGLARHALEKLPEGYKDLLQSQIEVKVAAFQSTWSDAKTKTASADGKKAKGGLLPTKKGAFKKAVPRDSRVLFKSLVFWGSNAWRYEKLEQPSLVTETMVTEALDIKDEWGDHDPHVFERWHGILPEPRHTLPGYTDAPTRMVVKKGQMSRAQYAQAADADADADVDDDVDDDDDAMAVAEADSLMANFDKRQFDTLDYEQKTPTPAAAGAAGAAGAGATAAAPKLEYDLEGLLDDDSVTFLAKTKLTKTQQAALDKRKIGAEMLRVAHESFSMNIVYHFGGNGKSYGGRGYDCSSWAGLVIARVTKGKHAWSRTKSSRPTTALMNTWCEKNKRWVKYEDTRVGDIVLTSRQRGGRISHVGFAAGGSFTCNKAMLAKQSNPKKITCGSRAGLKVIMVLHNGSYAKGLSYSFYAWSGKDKNRNLKICRPW